MKRKNKRTIKIIIICAVVAAVLAGGVLVIRFGNIGKKAQVYPVEQLNQEYMGDMNTLSATVTSGKIQRVKVKEGIINEVKVSRGDTVNKGDVLMVYDRSSFRITLMKDEARISSTTAAIAICSENIQKYSHLKPKEEAPQPEIETVDHGELPVKMLLTAADVPEVIRVETDEASGKASGKNEEIQEETAPETPEPVEAVILADSKISPDFLKKLRDTNTPAILKVYAESTGEKGEKVQTLYGYFSVNPNDLPKSDKESDPIDGFSDWQLSNIIKISSDGSGITVDTAGSFNYPGKFSPCTPEKYERYEEIIHYPEITDSEDYIYTREELANMIRQESAESALLQKELVSEKINYELDKLTASNGEVKATISGIVSEVLNPAQVTAGDDIITVKGSEKYTVVVYVNEMELDNIKLKDGMNLYFYEKGLSAHATVIEKEAQPSSQNFGYGVANPNNSYYPVYAEVDDAEIELDIGDWGEATWEVEDTVEKSLYIPIMYIRNEAGKSFVMKAENNRLKKQYITKGKTIGNYAAEIKDGITPEDYIAFPYDKGAVEGMPVEISEEVLY